MKALLFSNIVFNYQAVSYLLVGFRYSNQLHRPLLPPANGAFVLSALAHGRRKGCFVDGWGDIRVRRSI